MRTGDASLRNLPWSCGPARWAEATESRVGAQPGCEAGAPGPATAYRQGWVSPGSLVTRFVGARSKCLSKARCARSIQKFRCGSASTLTEQLRGGYPRITSEPVGTHPCLPVRKTSGGGGEAPAGREASSRPAAPSAAFVAFPLLLGRCPRESRGCRGAAAGIGHPPLGLPSPALLLPEAQTPRARGHSLGEAAGGVEAVEPRRRDFMRKTGRAGRSGSGVPASWLGADIGSPAPVQRLASRGWLFRASRSNPETRREPFSSQPGGWSWGELQPTGQGASELPTNPLHWKGLKPAVGLAPGSCPPPSQKHWLLFFQPSSQLAAARATMSGKSLLLKVLLLGDGGVGKSSLMNRYVTHKFDSQAFHTIGVEFLNQDLEVDGHLVTLQIWDTAGQERFKSLRTPFYRGADCCLLTFSVDDRQSFENLGHWQKEFACYASVRDPDHFPFVVLGNKVDKAERQVAAEEAQAWCLTHGDYPYLETSAKDDTNVAMAFEEAVRQVLASEEQLEPCVLGRTVDLHCHAKPGSSCC